MTPNLGGPVKITIFGLTLSSSWGNGHATPYRAILRALSHRGVQVVFYEKDVPYYAAHRDFEHCDYCDLKLYSDWNGVRTEAMRDACESDVVLTASYTPQGAAIADALLELHGPLRVFYDLDTPITLNRLDSGPVEYLRREQIPQFDLYLSFTGGKALSRLRHDFAAPFALPLYGCVDPDVYFRVPARANFTCTLSYLGTYAPDRQEKLDELFLEPARRRPETQFLLAGSLYPWQWQWPGNVRRFEHVSPVDHPSLYSSSRATLNITRQEMAESGYCPSGRFFEAAACGTPILTDWWQGLDDFFDSKHELCIVRSADEVLAGIESSDAELCRMASQARQRTLDEHTGQQRAAEFLNYCEQARRSKRPLAEVAA